jgi:hypothetical protein
MTASSLLRERRNGRVIALSIDVFGDVSRSFSEANIEIDERQLET